MTLLLAPLGVAEAGAKGGPSPASGPSADRCEQILPYASRAAEARARHASAFAKAAAVNDMTVAAFERLADDASVWLDKCGQVTFTEPEPTTANAATFEPTGDSPIASFPLIDTFKLESLPGANLTVFLDFDGHTVTNTRWNYEYGLGGASFTAGPYTQDADPNFSATELANIQDTWKAAAEDFASFNVNVTTKDPGVDALVRTDAADSRYGVRVIVGKDNPIIDNCNCGGKASLNTFDDTVDHAYNHIVFVSGATRNGGKTVSHEVGHTLGLAHDDALNGSVYTGYYEGATPWAPIMGVPTGQPVAHWSLGEYPYARNKQDDVAILASQLGVRADDYPNTVASATTNLLNGASVRGRITSRTDVDAIRFSGTGTTTIAVTGATFGNLDVALTIYNSSGTKVATVNPAVSAVSSSQASGLGATWTGTLPSGGATWTAVVDGVGTGDPLVEGKYSDYGSIGVYNLSVTSGPMPLTMTVSTPPAATVGVSYSASLLSTSGGVAPYTYAAGGLPPGLGWGPGHSIAGVPTTAGSFSAWIEIQDSRGVKVRKTVTFTVKAAPVAISTAASLPGAKVGTAYATYISATGGYPTYTWTRTSGTLPSGMTLSTTGGQAKIAGTPTAAGTYTFTLKATDTKGVYATKSFTVVVAPR